MQSKGDIGMHSGRELTLIKRPFANYYGIAFILYELSTPFLNIHWFLDKCNMSGSRFQLYNGIALLMTFFGSRLVWGTYQSVRIYQDIWLILQMHDGSDVGSRSCRSFGSVLPIRDQSEVMRFAAKEILPPWLTFVYLGSNTLLMLLNFYWFWKMIGAVSKRFSSSPKSDLKIAKE